MLFVGEKKPSIDMVSIVVRHRNRNHVTDIKFHVDHLHLPELAFQIPKVFFLKLVQLSSLAFLNELLIPLVVNINFQNPLSFFLMFFHQLLVFSVILFLRLNFLGFACKVKEKLAVRLGFKILALFVQETFLPVLIFQILIFCFELFPLFGQVDGTLVRELQEIDNYVKACCANVEPADSTHCV